MLRVGSESISLSITRWNFEQLHSAQIVFGQQDVKLCELLYYYKENGTKLWSKKPQKAGFVTEEMNQNADIVKETRII